MKRLKYLFFALAGTFLLAFLFLLLVLETVPSFFYFLIMGKPLGWNAVKRIFDYVESRFETITEYSYEGE